MPRPVAKRTASLLPNPSRLREIDGSADLVLMKPSYLGGGDCPGAHRHTRGQFLFPRHGRFRVCIEGQSWLASSSQAVWIPAGALHCVRPLEDTEIHNAYLCPDICRTLPGEPTAMGVSPLLAELIAFGLTPAACCRGPDCGRVANDQGAAEARRLQQVVADQIRRAGDRPGLHVPTSEDARLAPVLRRVMDNPADNRPLEDWAETAHLSSRTLSRLFLRETGMTFGQWRQRVRIIEAISRLGEGQPVLTVALDLGYASQSAFTAMFRKMTGRTPSEIRARRRGA